MRKASLVFSTLLTAAFLCLGGCSGDDGKDGVDGVDGQPGTAGTAGTPGTAGTNGLNCWDLNQNGVADLATEDTDKNGTVDVNDCRAPSGAYDPAGLHKGYFTENAYTGTPQCLYCHGNVGEDVMASAHWKWQGAAVNIVGFETDPITHGKIDLINNFCQAVPSNEGRCSQCHIGYGWQDKNFDFGNPKNIDCLACHDQTGTYKKVASPTATQPVAGGPDMTVEALQLVAQSVGLNAGIPRRSTCVFCHSRAGGDDNVKHGDVSTRMALVAPTNPDADVVTYLHRSEDVHMGVDPKATGSQKKGGNMTCVACHQAKKDAAGNMLDHGIGGFMYHSVDQGTMKDCTDCHGEATSIHIGTSVENLVKSHDRLACQTCHIPTFARKVSTYTDWRWASAGFTPPAGSTETHPADCAKTPLGVTATGAVSRVTYSKQKGCFTWGTNVRPTLRFYNGKWNRVIMGRNDKGLDTTKPVDLGSPAASYKDADAMIYPFKVMTGNQPFDATDKTVLVPHLWGTVTGPNPYWSKFDWNLALRDSADYSNLPALNNTPYGGVQVYNDSYVFADTVMLLKVDHEVAPKEQAYGKDNGCADCHFSGQIEWTALGWTKDPAAGGTQTLP
jgi:octaheme c-type cytochrome (tetrathionate reductase family)